jgi:hypothetical protein
MCKNHVSAAIQSKNILLKVTYFNMFTQTQNIITPLCRVTPIENFASLPQYDKEKYKVMVLDAAETVLGFFGFDRTAYSNLKNGRKKWYEELREQRTRDIETEML